MTKDSLAVVFLFDTCLGKQKFTEVTAKSGIVASIVDGLLAKGKLQEKEVRRKTLV